MTLSQSDYYPWTYYIFFVNNDGIITSLRHYKFTFQQDGASAHRASETVQMLKQVTPDFIPPTLWPSSSPDLNPVDYAVREIMHERVYKRKIKDVGELHGGMGTTQPVCD